MTQDIAVNPSLLRNGWEVVIGLEVHAQIVSSSKLFSGAATTFGADPNVNVSIVDAALPGVLPVINAHCIEQAIKTGLGIHAHINEISVFDRKNYFYPDLPQGYQISQYLQPIVGEGYLDIDLPDGGTKRVRITRIHLEQDAGKSFHDQHPSYSFIDLNRAGVALMEIVSEPDMRSPDEAMSYMKKLRALVRYLGTCDGNMEQGNLRADVNVSLRRPGQPYGTRTETKNLNSIRFLGQAIEYEIARQMDLLERGEKIIQETRLFDHVSGTTRSMRSKEDAQDYRYFPDPDLPPLVVSKDLIETIRAAMPELPDAKRERFMNDFNLSPYDAMTLTSEKEIADYYEQGLKALNDQKKLAKIFANWVMGELFAALNRHSVDIQESKVPAQHLAELVNLIDKNVISGKIAKDVFLDMWTTESTPDTIIRAKGLEQVSDEGSIRASIGAVLSRESDKVAEYKSGKEKLFGFFVGQVMKDMAGKGNPDIINRLLKDMLNG